MKDTLLSATTVEAVPIKFTHKDEHVVTIHGDDFIAAGSQQGWLGLALGRIGPNCSQRTGKFFRRTVECTSGACMHVQESIEELGLASGKVPSTLGLQHTVKNLADAEDSMSEVELGCKVVRERWHCVRVKKGRWK